jgi:hypothetical protein
MSKHQSPYKDKDGMRLPGVTTITGQELGWNKGVLINWANKKGLEGISTAEYTDNLADIGTLAHRMILDGLQGDVTDISNYSPNQVKKAENCLLSYHEWAKDKALKPILLEERLVSETYKFGGTPDYYGEVDGKLTLLDYKTGGIFDEHLVQVAGGYLMLLEENGYKVDSVQILGIPRTDGDSFQKLAFPQFKWQFTKKIFINCLENYKTKKLIKEE